MYGNIFLLSFCWAVAKIGYTWSIRVKIRYILKPSKKSARRERCFAHENSFKKKCVPKARSVPHGLQNLNGFAFFRVYYTWYRYHGLYLDLQRVTTNRLRLFRHGGSTRVPPVDSFKLRETILAEPPARYEIILPHQTWDHLDAGWCRQNFVCSWCCIDCCGHRKQQGTYTSQQLTEAQRTLQRRKSETSVPTYMYVCMHV